MKRFVLLPLCLTLSSAWAAEEIRLKEVIVTSSSEGDIAERQQAATQKVIINRQDIEAMGALTINDVLGKLPGVDVGTPSANGALAKRSRGMTRDSVQIFIDGELIPPGHTGMVQTTIGRLPSTELRQVEIIRGSSAEFGGSAPMSVHLVLNKPMARDSTDFKVTAGVRGDKPIVQTSYTKGGGDKTFSWSLPVTINHNEMPSSRQVSRLDNTGVRQEDSAQGNSKTDSFSFAPRLTWKSGSDNLTVNPMVFRSSGRGESDFVRSDLTTPANSYTRQDNDSRSNAFNRLRANAEMFRQGVKYSGRLSVSDGEQSTDTLRTNRTDGTQSQEQMRRQDVDLNGAFRLDWSAGQHILAANIEHANQQRDESQSNSGLATETHEAWAKHWSAWVQDEWNPSAAVTVTTGLRGEVIRYAVDGSGQSHQRLLPSMALRLEPVQHWVLRSSLGTGIKTPRLDELTNQPVFSVNANTPLEPDRRGNPDLRPERSVNFEAALERYLPGEAGVIGVNAYLRHTEDFTERRVQQEGARWVDRPYNEGSARHWGMELDGKLRTDGLGWRGATFRAHLTVPRSEVQDERLGISRAARESPRYILSAGYDQTMADKSFGVSMQHNGRVLTQVPGEQAYETRRRIVFDAYALQKLNSALNLRLSLQNLLRADTRSQLDAFAPGSSWSLASTDKGVRTVLLSLEGKW